MRSVKSPAFVPQRCRGATLFKFPTHGLVSVYVVEESDGSGFKALVEHAGPTGLEFKLVWDERSGPTLPEFVWKPSDPFEYRTGDGKLLVPRLPPKKSKPALKARHKRL